MWTPTDHWLEITIETLGRWEGWMCSGARYRKIPAENISSLHIWDFFSLPPTPPPRAGRHLPDTSPNKDRGGNLSN